MENNNTVESNHNNQALLSLYKEEKKHLNMPSDPFMSFKEWKKEYVIEWNKNHTITEADRKMEEADRLVQEADLELIAHRAKLKRKQKVKVKSTTNQIVVPTPPPKHSKKLDAIKVYRSMMKSDEHPSRKDVINAFVAKVNMSKAGASTYHHNIKKEFLEGKHK